MLLKQNFKLKCENCIQPVARRLALFRDRDEYECYAESYVKCFWGLCDHSTSLDNFVTKPDEKVITKQPMRQEIQYSSTINTAKDILEKSKKI